MQGTSSARIDILFFESYLIQDALTNCAYDRDCLRIQDYSNINAKRLGRISFILMKGHSKLYQQVTLPRFHVGQFEDGKEIFAKWTPHFDEVSSEYLTDSNGFDLITRKI